MFKNSMPNGCSYADLFIYPNPQKVPAKEAMSKEWYVGCKFYDPAQIKKYPKGYFWRKKGLAEFKTFKERKEAAVILKQEMQMALDKLYNPMPGICSFQTMSIEFSPNLFIIEAMQLAWERKTYSNDHKSSVKYALQVFEKNLIKLSLDHLKIKDVELIHVKKVLEKCELTNFSFNWYKKVLSSLSTDLVDEGCLKVNPFTGIKPKKHIVKTKDLFTDIELKIIRERIMRDVPEFYNFFEIFYMSGCRVPEILGLKKSDIDLSRSEFTILLRKGSLDVREKRAIVPDAIQFWTKQLKKINDDDYLFSYGFTPGELQLNRDYIYKYWKKKIRLKTIYTLKYTWLDKVEDAHYSAQIMAGHRDDRTTSIYTVGREKRRLEAQKQIRVNVVNEI